jgi:membrane-bound ClpP family serine protease
MAKKTKDTPKAVEFPFAKENYKLLVIGIVIIIIGFILMTGGGSDNPEVFDPAIFSFRRITLAPIVAVIGFVFIIYAIMKQPKELKEDK